MVLRFLLRYLANNEHLVNRLAESYPIRRAAQLVVYVFNIGKQTASNPQVGARRLQSFASRLQAELENARKEIKQASEDLKKRQ